MSAGTAQHQDTEVAQKARDQIVLARSTDGGFTFTNTELGRVYDDPNCYPLNVAQGRARLSFEQFRLSSFPSLAIDPSTGKMAIAWADDQGNAGCGESNPTFSGLTNNQVKLVTSNDGTAWTPPAIITSGADKAFPAVGMNAGRTVVGYYTRDYSPHADRERPLLRTRVSGNDGCGISRFAGTLHGSEACLPRLRL